MDNKLQRQALLEMGFFEIPLRLNFNVAKYFCYDQSFPGNSNAAGAHLTDGSHWERPEGMTIKEIERLESLGLHDGTFDFLEELLSE